MNNRNLREDLKSYYCFKDGYEPKYSEIEIRAIMKRKDTKQATHLAQIASQSAPGGNTPRGSPRNSPEPPTQNESPPPSNVPPPAPSQQPPEPSQPPAPLQPSYWILDHRIVEGVGDLRFYVRIWEGPWANHDKDQVVHYRNLDGQLQLRVTPDLKKPSVSEVVDPAHICCAGKFRTSEVAQLPNNAQGLYVIVEGAHIGKIVRRVNHLPEPPGNKFFVCKRIKVKKSQKTYDQSLMPDAVFVAHRDQLLEICESKAMKKAGNALVIDVRKALGGNWQVGGNTHSRA